MKITLALGALVFVCALVSVYADGYGHSYPMVIPSGGGGRGRKWQIRARGKGMQNMYMQQHHGGYDEKKYEKKKQEVVYYPVPIYTPVHHDEYEKHEYKDDHKVDVIPISLGHGGYGGYGGGHGGYGGGYGDLMSMLGSKGLSY